MRRADGFTLLELLVVLTVAALVGTLVLGTLTAQLRLARTTAQHVVERDAVRTATTILSGDVRRTMPADVRSLARDSLALRAFRGVALVCATSTAGTLVSYRGDRMPDITKDSAVAVSAGTAHAVAVRSIAPDPAATCVSPWGGASQLWRLERPVPAGLLLVFESGNYYLAARALRYRLGGEGRQPLTQDVFVHPATSFLAARPAAIGFALATAGAPQPQSLVAHHAGHAP